jgi:hypothetical protein
MKRLTLKCLGQHLGPFFTEMRAVTCDNWKFRKVVIWVLVIAQPVLAIPLPACGVTELSVATALLPVRLRCEVSEHHVR